MKNFTKQSITTIIIVAVVCLGAGYYIGKSQSPAPGARGNFPGINGANRTGAMRTLGGNGAPISGDIISKDATSITLKLKDGGSKIIFVGTSTPITKSVSGSPADLSTNETVVVQGTTNADGSATAQSIQIRGKQN